MSDDLIVFLRARLGEDADIAERTNGQLSRRMAWDARQVRGHTTIALTGTIYELAEDVVESVALHIARHDPARVLAEVAAKREIVTELVDQRDDGTSGADTAYRLACAVAKIYSEHPDYQQEWKP